MSCSFVKRLVFLVVSGISLFTLALMMPLTSYAHSTTYDDDDGYSYYQPRIAIGSPAYLVTIGGPPVAMNGDEDSADAVNNALQAKAVASPDAVARKLKVLVVKIPYKCFTPKPYGAAEERYEDAYEYYDAQSDNAPVSAPTQSYDNAPMSYYSNQNPSYNNAPASYNSPSARYIVRPAFAVVLVKQVVRYGLNEKVIWGETPIYNLRCDGKKHLALVVVTPLRKYADTFYKGKALVKAYIYDSLNRADFAKKKVKVVKARLVL